MIRLPVAVAAAVLIPIAFVPQADRRIGPLGASPSDGIRLATGAVITPAGSHQITGDMIQTAEVSPDGKTIAMNCGGAAAHRILLLDPATGQIRQSIPVGRAQGTGLAWGPDSRTLYANGGNSGRIHVLRLDENGKATEGMPIALEGTGSFQSGLAVSPDGTRLIVGDIGVPTLRLIDPSTGKEATRRALKRRERPGVLRWAPDGKTVLLADWGSDKVHILDPVTLETQMTVTTAAHPNDIRIAGDRVFVSCGNADQVVVFDRRTGAVSERIHTALTPKAPVGATPSALAIAPDLKTLFVANSDTNSVMVVDVATPGKSETEGFIPTAHYPTAVAIAPDGKHLIVGCGKGLGTGPNPPPASEKGKARPSYPYIATLLNGVVSTVAHPNPAQLAAYTKQVYFNNPYSNDSLRETPANVPQPGTSVVPSRVGERSPIRHVLYIIKENRTYDQVFGDMEKGDGDKDLAIYGEDVTPNHHALAREYV
ncbi:MAG: WD40 repeat domain-containing protein, partial [Armatimonadaceae bacterium]